MTPTDLGIEAGHERGSTRAADGELAVCAVKSHAAGGECVDVWRPTLPIAVATEGGGGEVIGDDEENVAAFGRTAAGCQQDREPPSPKR